MTTEATARPVMTSAELATHYVARAPRDYSMSDDGSGDMAVLRRQGWRVLSGWG